MRDRLNGEVIIEDSQDHRLSRTTITRMIEKIKTNYIVRRFRFSLTSSTKIPQ